MADTSLELFPDPLLILAPDGRVLASNAAAAGIDVARLVPPRAGRFTAGDWEVHAREVQWEGEKAFALSLRRHEERLRLLLESAPFAILVLGRDGRVEYANPFFLHLTGRRESDVVGRYSFGAFLADTSRVHFQSELVTIRGVRHISWTHSILRGGAGTPDGFLFLGADVTETFETNAALQRSEKRFRALVEGSPDGIALCHRTDVLYANPALERLLGRVPSDLRAHVHPDDLSRLSRDARVLFEARLVRGDAGIVHVEIASMPAETERGPGVLLVVRDLGERRRMHQQLVQSSRLAAIGTLAAGVAHEINNPLAFVDSNLQFIASLWPATAQALDAAGAVEPPPELRGEVTSALADAALGVERVRAIVERLKQLARNEAHATPLDVRGPLEDALAIVGHELDKRVTVVRELKEAPRVAADPQRLVQAFVNVLLNAVQAIPADRRGTVRIACEGDEEGNCLVRISDDGVGIAPEALDRLFDPFFTTRTTGAGEGLGLSVAHAIVASMGGEIAVDSEPGKGSTFLVLLPPASA